MAAVGRNDPCPCGSGRKYKKCCLAADETASRELARQHQTRESALRQLLDFSDDPEFDDDHEVAEMLFWADCLDGLSDADADELISSDDAIVKYNCWFLFDLDIDGEQTVADMFLERHGDRLDPGEYGFIDRMRRAHLALYEVERVELDTGLHLVDLWTGGRSFVRETVGSHEVVRWDLLAARVVPHDSGSLMFEGGLYLLPSAEKSSILREFRRLHRAFQKQTPGASDAAFFRRHGMIFHHLWLDYVVLQPPPRMQTSEGDEMVFSEVVFDLVDEAAVRAAFEAAPDLDPHDDDSFAWLEESGDVSRSLGTWTFGSGRLWFEATSKERAARARDWLEALVPAGVTYRATGYETVAEALRSRRAAGRPDPTNEVPPDIAAQVVGDLYDSHYREWLDLPLPALGNRTPRHAVKLKTMAPRVVDLLKQMENYDERGRRRHGRPAYDFAWIWKELGLERPDE